MLDGGYLSDDPSDRAMWKISSLTLQPGERVVIPCSGTDAPAGEADFALAAGGCSVVLTGANGNVISSVECPRLGDDRVWALQEDGSWLLTVENTLRNDNFADETVEITCDILHDGQKVLELSGLSDTTVLLPEKVSAGKLAIAPGSCTFIVI